MSDLDLIEQRLRQTFRAVAELPVASIGTEAGVSAIQSSASRFPRHLRVVSLAFVAVVAIAVLALVIAYGPLRSKSSNEPASPGSGIAKSKLQAAINATFDASGYVSTTNTDPSEVIVTNAPDLIETIDSGLVSDIDVGNTEYIASWSFALKSGYHFGPNHCGPHDRYIKMTAEGFATASYSLQGTDVVAHGDVFTVSREGTVTETFVVRSGYVVQITQTFPSAGKAFVTSFSEIGHAPKIVVPPSSEVVSNPHVFYKGCPLNVP
ncbi:MAG: hypothetical protein ACLP6E_07255 [Acidimicrobiales bacterium]